jgi:AcrR family transcriptional regulator
VSQPARRPPAGTTTRDRLIAAAQHLIPELGWGAVSTRLVAERAGTNPGVVHYHVDSIEDLRRLAAVRGVREFFAGPAAGALAGTDAHADLAGLFAALSPPDPHDPRLLLLYESLVAAARDEALRAELAKILQEYRTLVETWLAELGVRAPHAAAVTLTAAVDGYLLQRALDPRLDPAPLVAGLAQMTGHPRRSIP